MEKNYFADLLGRHDRRYWAEVNNLRRVEAVLTNHVLSGIKANLRQADQWSSTAAA